MPPNWKKFQNITQNMIETMLGAEPVTVTVHEQVGYDFETGESSTVDNVQNITVGLMPITKDDIDYIPEGKTDRVVRKMYSTIEIDNTALIYTPKKEKTYKVIVPSARLCAGGMNHAWRTFIAEIDTDYVEAVTPVPPEGGDNP